MVLKTSQARNWDEAASFTETHTLSFADRQGIISRKIKHFIVIAAGTPNPATIDIWLLRNAKIHPHINKISPLFSEPLLAQLCTTFFKTHFSLFIFPK
jgi:hypothetical protein